MLVGAELADLLSGSSEGLVPGEIGSGVVGTVNVVVVLDEALVVGGLLGRRSRGGSLARGGLGRGRLVSLLRGLVGGSRCLLLDGTVGGRRSVSRGLLLNGRVGDGLLLAGSRGRGSLLGAVGSGPRPG